jgi:thiamine-monophosphate kinase
MPERLSDIGEFGLIDRIHALIRREGFRSNRVTLGIGDDTAAFLPRSDCELLVTCDALVEGRHFLPDRISPFDLGRRAMTQNISDIGAMGGRPLYALVSLGLRKDTAVSWIMALYRGFLEEMKPFKAAIIGGNLTESGNGLFIDITVVGEVVRGKGVHRSGARPGDLILVSGYPGESAAGLQLLLHSKPEKDRLNHPLVQRYNNPTHRAFLGAALAETGLVTAMIDISDGLLGDLGHLCAASKSGAEIFKEKLLLSDNLRRAADHLGLDPYDWVLGDSDDYELILTCRPEHGPRLQILTGLETSVPLTEIGRITKSAGAVSIIQADGTRSLAKPSGWDHFRKKNQPAGK